MLDAQHCDRIKGFGFDSSIQDGVIQSCKQGAENIALADTRRQDLRAITFGARFAGFEVKLMPKLAAAGVGEVGASVLASDGIKAAEKIADTTQKPSILAKIADDPLTKVNQPVATKSPATTTPSTSGTKLFELTPAIERDFSAAMANWDLDAAVDALHNAGWKSDKTVLKAALEKVPPHLRGEFKLARSVTSKTDRRGGVRFGGEKDNIRIMQGKPDADFAHQRVDYVRITRNSQAIGQDGKGITTGKPDRMPETHISLEEYVNNWNEGLNK